jgi:hypothetical protein
MGKTINHRDTAAQRKAKEGKAISGFLVFDFLHASVVDGFHGLQWRFSG